MAGTFEQFLGTRIDFNFSNGVQDNFLNEIFSQPQNRLVEKLKHR